MTILGHIHFYSIIEVCELFTDSSDKEVPKCSKFGSSDNPRGRPGPRFKGSFVRGAQYMYLLTFGAGQKINPFHGTVAPVRMAPL